MRTLLSFYEIQDTGKIVSTILADFGIIVNGYSFPKFIKEGGFFGVLEDVIFISMGVEINHPGNNSETSSGEGFEWKVVESTVLEKGVDIVLKHKKLFTLI